MSHSTTTAADAVQSCGWATLDRTTLAATVTGPGLAALQLFWNDLPLDEELVDGGLYRERRFGRLAAAFDPMTQSFTLSALPHTPFQQSAEDIPLHGGRQRLFAPADSAITLHPAMTELVAADLAVAQSVTPHDQWTVNLHLIRIIAQGQTPGLPTPEGRHRDGHWYVGMHLINRVGCTGGKSRIYPGEETSVQLVLSEPLDSIIIDDRVVTHEVTPIGAIDQRGVRDMLLVDLNPA